MVLTDENSGNTSHQNKSFLYTYSIQKQNPFPVLYIYSYIYGSAVAFWFCTLSARFQQKKEGKFS